MGVNSFPKTVTGQRRDCDLNPGPSAPESSTLATRLPSHPREECDVLPSACLSVCLSVRPSCVKHTMYAVGKPCTVYICGAISLEIESAPLSEDEDLF